MTRILFEDWSSYADFAAFSATIGVAGAKWSAGTLTGLEFDSGVTYNGHKTLRYRPDVAGAAASLTHTLAAGFNRLWARVAFRVSATMYDSGLPADGSGPLPLAHQVENDTWAARAGLWEKYDDAGTPRFRGKGTLVSSGESLSNTHKWSGNGDTIGKPTLQGLGWQESYALVERQAGGDEVRLRVWRAALADAPDIPIVPPVLILDRVLNNVAVVDYWLRYVLRLDAVAYGAGNDVHVGEIELFDAERGPDPFRIAWLFSDGFDSYSFGTSAIYEYGLGNAPKVDGSGPTGHCYLGCWTSGQSFTGKDFRRPDADTIAYAEAEVSIGVRFRAWRLTADKMICSFRSNITDPATDTRDAASTIEICSIWHRSSDRKLELRRGATVVATSPTAIELSTGELASEFVHLWIDVGFGNSNGFLRVKKDGDGSGWWWSVDGATAGSDGVTCAGICLGSAVTPSSTSPGMDFDDLVVSRGVEFRLAAIEHLPPWANGENEGWSIDAGSELGIEINGGFQEWLELWTDLGSEPSQDAGYLTVPTGQDRISVVPCPLPDPDCGGLVAMIIPMPDLRHDPADPVPTNDAWHTYVKSGASRDDSPIMTGTRQADPPPVGGFFAAFPGANGFATFVKWGWPRNPWTGEAWDPASLPEIGVKPFGMPLEMPALTCQVVLVRPSNEGPFPPATTSVFPRRNGDWRTPDALAPWRNGLSRTIDPTAGDEIHVMRNGLWRLVEILSGGSVTPYCPLGPQPLPFAEGHDGDRIYTRVWSPLTLAATPGTLTIASGILRIDGPDSWSASGDDTGLVSNGLYQMPNGSIEVEIPIEFGFPVTVADIPGRMQVLEWGNAQAFVFFRYQDGFFEYGDDVRGVVASNIVSAGWWWRLRHDSAALEIVAETSADGVTWVEFYRDDNDGFGWTDDDMMFCEFAIYIRNTSAGAAADTTVPAFRNFAISAVPHL